MQSNSGLNVICNSKVLSLLNCSREKKKEEDKKKKKEEEKSETLKNQPLRYLSRKLENKIRSICFTCEIHAGHSCPLRERKEKELL